MSRGDGVVDGEELPEAPLPDEAFRSVPLERLHASQRALVAALTPGSPRLEGAAPEVAAAAATLRPFLVEALAYLQCFRERFVREGEPAERAPVDFDSHVRRYALTVTLVRARAAAFAAEFGRPLRVLDVGGPGVINGALRADVNVELSATEGDLRHRFATGPHPGYELVLCSEVIEHVTDPQVGYRRDTRLDYNAEVLSLGARHALARLAAVIEPEGAMLLTTPNAVSLYALRELGQRRPAAIYRPHYREYAPRELAELLTGAGLFPVLTTCDAYAFYDLREEIEYLRRVGAPDACRFWGDTILAFAYRSERTRGAPALAAELEAIVRAFAPDQMVAALGLDALAADRLP